MALIHILGLGVFLILAVSGFVSVKVRNISFRKKVNNRIFNKLSKYLFF